MCEFAFYLALNGYCYSTIKVYVALLDYDLRRNYRKPLHNGADGVLYVK